MAKEEADAPRADCDLRFSSAVYSLDTIKKAAYRLSGHCSFDFEVVGGEILCRLHFAQALSSERMAAIKNGFRNEVLDQDLRRTIAEETGPMRNAILAYAFSRTGLQDGDEV